MWRRLDDEIDKFKNKSIASDYVAVELLKLVQSTPTATLGLATGNTMTEIIHDYLNY